MKSSRIALAAALALLSSSCLVAPSFAADSKALAKAPAIPASVSAALNDGNRLPAEITRDVPEHTAAILAFTGIKPGDKVAEIVPANGYFTRILAKLVGPKGKYYGVIPLADGVRDGETLRAKVEDEAKKSGKPVPLLPVDTLNAIQNIADYANVQPLWQIFWQYGGAFSVPEQLDAVFTANIYHDLHIKTDYGIPDVGIIDKRIFDSMKPGGVFIILDNRGAKGTGFTQVSTLHRADPDAVKAEMLSAGFVFDGESNAAANPSDGLTETAQGAEKRTKTDHYLYRFKKPLNAPNNDLRPTHDVLTGFYGNTTISGDPGTPQRFVFYHPDHTYQEFGWNDMQSGTWYWDAAGHNCMLHQWPAVQRNFVVCHGTGRDKHVGDKWTQDNGQPFQGNARPYIVVSGYQYPDPKPPAGDNHANIAPK